ncbi:MAG: hypothetical protein WA987_10310 [Cellvibrio sp.]|jgi:hypothetical protein
MSEKKLKAVTFEQIAEALEERQTPDRRKEDRGLPEGVTSERRKGDRRKGSEK